MQENNTIEQIAVESPDIAEKTQVEQPLQQDAKIGRASCRERV